MEKFIQCIQKIYSEAASQWSGAADDKIMALRNNALQKIKEQGFPTSKEELWRHFPIEKKLQISLLG